MVSGEGLRSTSTVSLQALSKANLSENVMKVLMSLPIENGWEGSDRQ